MVVLSLGDGSWHIQPNNPLRRVIAVCNASYRYEHNLYRYSIIYNNYTYQQKNTSSYCFHIHTLSVIGNSNQCHLFRFLCLMHIFVKKQSSEQIRIRQGLVGFSRTLKSLWGFVTSHMFDKEEQFGKVENEWTHSPSLSRSLPLSPTLGNINHIYQAISMLLEKAIIFPIYYTFLKNDLFLLVIADVFSLCLKCM